MSLKPDGPDGAPAGFHYQARATVYLVGPAGAYSPPGPSAPPTDPGGPDTWAAAYIPITGATSVAAEIVDPKGAYGPAAMSAPPTDPAASHGGVRGSSLTLAAAGGSFPIPGVTSALSEIVDPAGACTLASTSAATIDPAATDGGAGAGTPTLAAASASIAITCASSAAPEIVELGDKYSGAGASAPTAAASGAYIPVTEAISAAAEIVFPLGAYFPPGAYLPPGATAPIADPGGAHSGASAATADGRSAAGASAPTLAAQGAYIPLTKAASAATETSPPGTYLPPGATAPIADPEGTHSAAGASAPTTDPAGTYSSKYALNRLFIIYQQTTPADVVLSFHSETAVENYYGATSSEATLAKEFFAGYAGTSATISFTRFGLGQRPHLLGANISNLTLARLQEINGSLAATFDGYTYSGSINLSKAKSLSAAAGAVQSALNSNLQVAAVTAGSSITPESASVTGYSDRDQLYIMSVSSGVIEIGGWISGPGGTMAQIINQLSGIPGGPGHYATFQNADVYSSAPMTETYGVLTVGAVDSGTVTLGEEVTGTGIPSLTAIDGNLSGSGPGSTWIVDNAPAQTVTGDLTMTAPPLSSGLASINGATENNDFINLAPNSRFGFDFNPSSLSYVSGSAAAALGLTQASGAIDSSPGGQHPTTAQFMNDIVQDEYDRFGSFETDVPRASQALSDWAQSVEGYRFIPTVAAKSTPPAGASRPTLDPAGTYSGRGASAPTPAAPGTYIPGAGATSAQAQIIDPAGSYSLAGASAPTLAQPGYYVPKAGASYETPDDPGYYTPYAGATAERLVQAPTISGAVAGQRTPSEQTDTPFSTVTITNPNQLSSDSLSIQITGGGGSLADGAGFTGLTESAAGVYLLSGTAAAITSELDALIFTPNTFSATTTFTLTDTTSLGSSASNANTNVTVTNGEPFVVFVATFLANQATLDKIPGGFEIFDSAADITAALHQLHDSHIDAIIVSDNGNVGVSVAQLTTQTTAIGKLQNANLSPVLLAVTDTTADILAGLSMIVQDAGEIASVTASDDGPIVVSAATFLADQPALDKIVGGFAVSDTAANITAALDQLDDPNISTITISDNGEITASVAQLATDATAIGKLGNANGSSVLLAVNDTAGDVQTGLSTLVQDMGEIGTITTSYGPIVVSVATFLADQSTLNKIVGGFDVSDSAANLVADLSALDADSNVDAITADIGDATLSGGVGVTAPSFSETGWGTSLIVGEALSYGGAFTVGAGSAVTIAGGDSVSLSGNSTIAGALGGAGVLIVSGPGTVTIDAAETYTGGTTIAGGTLFLAADGAAGSGAITFASGAGGTLQIAAGVDPTNTIWGFDATDTIALAGVGDIGSSSGAEGPFALAIAGNVATQDFIDGWRAISTFNITGQTYTSDDLTYGADGYLHSALYDGVTGDGNLSSFEYLYGGDNLIGTDEFYTRVAGEPYTGEQTDYNGAGAVTRDVFTGVTGAPFSSFEDDYVGGVYAGAEYTFTSVPQGASYSSYVVDESPANVFSGEQFFFTDIVGQSYTGEEKEFDADNQLSEIVLTGVTGQAYSSLELDYSAGAYEGYQAYYYVTGQTYTNQEVDVSASGQLEKVIDSGMTSTPYSSIEEDYSGGALVDTISSFADVTGASYNAYQVEDSAGGTALQETLDLNSGGHDLIALASGQTLTSLGDDVMTGSATGATTFTLNAVYGADTITNLTNGDIVSMPDSEFTSFTALSAAASFQTGVAVIKAGDGDTLTLKGVTTMAQLQNLSGDFTFHS
jgi:autotransporter-associated beta strand protein